MRSRPLILVALLWLVWQGISTAIAIIKKLPADAFGVNGDPNNIVRDFLLDKGTALSAPLVVLLVLALFVVLALRRDRWGTLGVGGIAVLGAVTTVFGAGESLTWVIPSFGLMNWASILLSLLMLAFGIRELAQRRKSRA